MFIAADDLSKLATHDIPDWARDWLESRTERKEKAENKKKTAKPKNEETAARSREKRAARVDEGIDADIHVRLSSALSPTSGVPVDGEE